MFDVAPSELLILGTVALLVIPPKDLPKAMRVAGYWVGRVRGVARQFRSGFDSMLRDAELQEMEKRWAEENARIMREHPPTPAMLMSPAPADMPAPTDMDEAPTAPVMTEQPTLISAPELTPKRAGLDVPTPEAPLKTVAPRKPRAKKRVDADIDADRADS